MSIDNKKVFNTRIQLKYATWAEWQAVEETFIPLKGEICVVAVPTGASDGLQTEKPAILFKVGDGESTLKALNWASGHAADVYEWAKREKGLATEIFTAENVSVEEVLAGLKDALDNLEASEVAYTKKTKNEAGETIPGEVIDVEVALDSLYEAISTLSGDSSESIADLITKVNKNTEDIASLKESILALPDTYASKTAFETHVEEVKDYGTRLDTVEDVAAAAATKTALDEEIARAKAAEEANAANIKTISDDYVKSADIAEFETKANVQAVADARYTKEEADAKFALAKDAYDDTEVRGLIQENADAITEVGGKVNTLIGEDANKSVRTIANEELAAKLIAADAAESLDTLEEIAAWIQEHPGDAADMNLAITKLQAIVAGIGGENEKATVVAYVNDAIAALNIGDYAKAADLTALAGRVEALENAGHQNAEQVKASITEEIEKLDSEIAATAADETTGEISVLTKITQENGVLTGKEEAKLAKVASTGNINDLVQTEDDYVVFYCGDATTFVDNPTV